VAWLEERLEARAAGDAGTASEGQEAGVRNEVRMRAQAARRAKRPP
jgi:hypothetical protein